MQTVTLILLVITVILSLVAVIFAAKAASKNESGDTEILSKKSEILGEKIDSMQRFMSAEMSNNRSETSRVISELNGKIADMTEKSLEQQHRNTVNINETLSGIRISYAEQSEKTMRTLTAAIDKMTLGNEKKLEEMRATVDEKLTSTLTTRLDSSFKTVSGQLEKLYVSLGEMKELSGGITSNVTSLNRILTNVKTRGTWAEYQLEGILDQIIPNMYVKNYKSEKSEKNRDFVEFAVKIPSSDDSGKITYLPIDSKFPMEDYARLCSAADSADAEAVAAARKALEKRVTDEAKTVAKYINEPETTPFAIMYLATEGLYAEIASSKSGLLEKIQNEFRVMIAGPTTVTALLNSFAMGFRTLAVNEKANEIKQILEAVKGQYDTFDAVLKKIKKKITEADNQIDSAAKRNEIILKKLKNIDAAESIASDTLLEIPEDL